MRTNNQLRIILVEILVAVLFFGLAATILIETFATGYTLSQRAAHYSTALSQAQSIADRLYIEKNEKAVFQEAGWQRSENGWTMTSDDGVLMTAAIEDERTKAGTLYRVSIRAVENDLELLNLAANYYAPAEGAEHE